MESRHRSLVPIAFAIVVAAACAPAPPQFSASPAAATATATATAAATPTASAAPSPTQVVPTQAPLGFTPGTKAAPRKIDIVGNDQLTFWPNVVVVAEGETVTFKVSVSASGKAIHEFMVGPEADALADKEGTPEVADIMPGTSKSLTFTFDGPGPYAFACHAPGHFEAGMQGYIVVIGPDVPKVGTKANPRLVEMSMDDTLKFMPDAVAVANGETVRFLLTNAGTVVHEFAVGPKDKVDADEVDGIVVKEADEIEAHHLKVLDYTFDGTGPYGYACHEPGHFQAGMFGNIVLASS